MPIKWMYVAIIRMDTANSTITESLFLNGLAAAKNIPNTGRTDNVPMTLTKDDS